MTDCNRNPLPFPTVERNTVVADFLGGQLLSDVSALLLRGVAGASASAGIGHGSNRTRPRSPRPFEAVKWSHHKKGNPGMRHRHTIVALGLAFLVLTARAITAETDPPASSEVTAAMQPYLERYKLAGVIGI